MNFIIVFIGGGLGSICRYGINIIISRNFNIHFPLATLICNFISALIIGGLIGMALGQSKLSDTHRLLLVTGFCGGFSTFSAFTFETFELMRAQQNGLAIANVVLSIAGCLFFFWIGWKASLNLFNQ